MADAEADDATTTIDDAAAAPVAGTVTPVMDGAVRITLGMVDLAAPPSAPELGAIGMPVSTMVGLTVMVSGELELPEDESESSDSGAITMPFSTLSVDSRFSSVTMLLSVVGCEMVVELLISHALVPPPIVIYALV